MKQITCLFKANILADFKKVQMSLIYYLHTHSVTVGKLWLKNKSNKEVTNCDTLYCMNLSLMFTSCQKENQNWQNSKLFSIFVKQITSYSLKHIAINWWLWKSSFESLKQANGTRFLSEITLRLQNNIRIQKNIRIK